MSFRHPLRAACLAPLCLIVQLAFLVAPHAAYAVGTADGYVSVGTTTNPTSQFGVYGGATIGSSYNNILAPTNGLLVQGNVGIGTTSPTSPLHIYGSFAATPTINLQNLSATGYTQLAFYGTGRTFYTGVGNGSGGLGVANKYYVWDASMSVMRLVIDTSGNVGIGTTAPQSKLQIQSGEVQVGSSGASCSVANAGAISYASGALSYCNGSAWTSAASGTGSTGYDALWTSPTAIGTGLIYESGGNVGIGTAGPVVNFQEGNVSPTTPRAGTNAIFSGAISGCNGCSSSVSITSGSTGEGFLDFGAAGGLSIAGTVSYNQASNFMRFSTNASERMRIDSSGNVGIGTTTPVATLDVNGYAHLAKNSSQPIACDAAHDGSLALASTRRPCECVSSAWIDVVYGTACSW